MFLNRGPLMWLNKFGGTPKHKKGQNYENNSVLNALFKIFQDLVAQLKKIHGTLVCRG